MMRQVKWIGMALVLVFAAAAYAHHSFAMFDQTQQVTLKGTVREFQWTNPHAWIHLDVPTADGVKDTPPGMPGIMGVGQYPIEFLFTPGRVTTHHEAWMQWRNIYTDGRGHPDDLEATFAGDSIGRWEGATLVVDTIGIKESVALDMGMKHSDKLHLTERIHLDKADPDTLVVEMTAEDPVALAKPWLHTFTYKRSREWSLLEFICAENDRNPVDAYGTTGFKQE